MKRTTLLLAALTALVGIGLFLGARAVQRGRAQLDADRKLLARLQAQLSAARAARETGPDATPAAAVDVAAPPAASPVTAERALLSAWNARVQTLKQHLATHAGESIPELALLTENDWLHVARFARLENAEQLQAALAELRSRAKELLAQQLRPALRQFAAAHNGQLPAGMMELAPFCAPGVTAPMLERYALTRSGPLGNSPNELLIAEQAPLDPEREGRLSLSLYGSETERISSPLGSHGRLDTLAEATAAFARANAGRDPENVEQLRPYLRDPTVLETLLDFEQAAQRFGAANRGSQPEHPEQLRPFLKNPMKLDEMLRAAGATPPK